MTEFSLASPFTDEHGDWQARLAFVVEMMRELSSETDPQGMVRTYGARMRKVVPSDAFFSLSRRELARPLVRMTRSSSWEDPINPWKSKDRLPVFEGGLLSRLIYGDEPVIFDDLSTELADDDPAIDYLRGYGSMVAIPLYDRGEALNMVALLRKETFSFNRETLPQHVWLSNLFGRATHNLVLSDQVKRAYEQVDRELRVVAEIQRSLLPTKLPAIPGVDLAAHYQTSMRAGGDYYDFFQMPDGRWGILIADVSGHGTPAAVIMAVTHSIAHMVSEPPAPPSRLLNHVNTHLAARYTGGSGTFVTAFYGIFDPLTRKLEYASAGHPPPRVLQCGQLSFLDGERSLPLGIDECEQYIDCERQLNAGDTLVLYTDGISEARNPRGELFGEDRLDRAVCCAGSASQMLDAVLREVDRFRGGRTLADDRTLLIARLTPDADEKGAGI